MKSKFLTIIFLILIAFPSCEKEEENSTEILLSKTWKRGVVDKNPSTNPTGYEIGYAIVSDCDKDDTFKFDSDGNLIINRNANKCDQNELQTENVTYYLDRTTKEFTIDGIKYTLAEESKSQIKYYILVPSGVSFGKYAIFLLQ
jgi:hypothetical protein